MLSFLDSDKDPAPAPGASGGWLARLRAGLAASREKLGQRLAAAVGAHARLDEALLEDLGAALITCDVGVAAAGHLIDQVRAAAKHEGISDPARVQQLLKRSLLELLAPLEQPLITDTARPFVILLAGVNGSGKTTSIGKLARHLRSAGRSVLLAAGDTFRAAAREQLKAWAERNDVSVISQEGGDPAAVIFDAINAARARGIDVVLADTAGRLPTQLHLMEELKKVKRVVAKASPGAPQEVLLVLDANTGQNALAQVKAFDDALGVTGLLITKLDGTAKGGALAAIARHKPIPVRFVGVGEAIDDMRPFHAEEFVDALLG